MHRDDPDAVERFNRYLDAAATEVPALAEGVDPALAATVQRVRRLDRAPAADPAFLARLEARLASPTGTSPTGQPLDLGVATPAPPRPPTALPRPEPAPRPGRRSSLLALAAIVLLDIGLVAGFEALRPAGGRQSGHAGIPGYAVAPTQTTVGCTVAPRSIQFFRGLLGTPIPATTPPPFNPRTGVPAAPSVVAGVTATMQELVACTNAGDALGLYALLTDAYLRQVVRERGPNTPQAVADLARYTPTPAPATEQRHLVEVDSVRQWPDGRVGAVVTIGYDVRYSLAVQTDDAVFAPANGGWLIDWLSPVIPPGAPGALASPQQAPGMPATPATPFAA